MQLPAEDQIARARAAQARRRQLVQRYLELCDDGRILREIQATLVGQTYQAVCDSPLLASPAHASRVAPPVARAHAPVATHELPRRA
jgi:hypothetical protein